MVIQSRTNVNKTTLPAAIRRRLTNQGKSLESEAHALLRDMAFVLKQVESVREEILGKAAPKPR
jgi:hypothetical protein